MCLKLLFCSLLLAGYVQGQTPVPPVRRDSIPEQNTILQAPVMGNIGPDLRRALPNHPRTDLPGAMPVVRPQNSFYRNPADLPGVMRASLDNMPVKIPDSSVIYTMLRKGQPNGARLQPPAIGQPVFPKK